MIELIYQQPGMIIFLLIWIVGILTFVIKRDEDLVGVAIVYTFLYGMYKIIMIILGVR